MIARTAIDARALTELLASPTRVQLAHQRRLATTLREHGQLVWTDEADRTELFNAIKAQPNEHVRILWVETLKALQHSGRCRGMAPSLGSPTSMLCETSPLEEQLRSRVDLMVVSAHVAEAQGFDEVGHNQGDGEPELVVLDALDSSPTLQAIHQCRGRGHFPSDTQRDVFWAMVLGPLASVSREVTVLDRYLASRSLSGQGKSHHVQWLLEQLDATMSPGGQVRLLAAEPDRPMTSDEMRSRLLPIIPRSQGVGVSITIAPWSDDRDRGPHDRHARFSCGPAITLEEGFDRLRDNKIWGIDGLSWSYRTDPDMLNSLVAREQFVQNHPNQTTVEFPPTA